MKTKDLSLWIESTPNPIDQKELEAYFWEAANILRGRMDAADFKSYIFPLVFYKRISDVYDEEYKKLIKEFGDEDYASFEENHRFIIPKLCHWSDLRKQTSNIGKKIKESMLEIEKSNPRLEGIFGDTNWTNKDRLPDKLLKDLIEHFSKINLSNVHVPEDQLGNAYEYLIRKFADDSGHTAAEFYTNRTLVRLMTKILDPQPGDSIYDPTCGSGGMLLSALKLVKEQGLEYRTIKLFGQEINIITSAIAKMNLYLHGLEDFYIVREDTLSKPAFIDKNGRLMKFDVIFANPPYSLKRWDQDSWAKDPHGRNEFGIPPAGCADYAFFQHIIHSLSKNGRSAILFPHGILFRESEADIRKNIIETDLIDTIIGMGPNLFYNSSMDSCIIILRKRKNPERKNKIFFIDAYDLIERKNAYSYLTEDHIKAIYKTERNTIEKKGFSKLVNLNEIRKNKYRLTISQYVPTHLYKDSFPNPKDESIWVDNIKKIQKIIDDYNKEIYEFRDLISHLKINKKKRIELQEVVEYKSKNINNPLEKGLKRYVGLEHLKPNYPLIEEWGNVIDGTSFTRFFQSGDILFSKRRVYLRKAAIVNFEGVCSGDLIVIKAKEDIILSDYLVNVLLSDEFLKYALYESAGTMSPRTKWKNIKNFNFLLPDIQDQSKIVEKLNVINKKSMLLKESLKKLLSSSTSLQQISTSSIIDFEWKGEN